MFHIDFCKYVLDINILCNSSNHRIFIENDCQNHLVRFGDLFHHILYKTSKQMWSDCLRDQHLNVTIIFITIYYQLVLQHSLQILSEAEVSL